MRKNNTPLVEMTAFSTNNKNDSNQYILNIVIQSIEVRNDENDIVILAASEKWNDVILSKGSNDMILRMLEVSHEKQHDIVSIKLNDVISCTVGLKQMEGIRAKSSNHFA